LDGLALGGGGGATFDEPVALSVTKSDSVAPHGVVIADRRNSRIRKLEKGYVRSISGSNFAYADGVGTSAKYRFPSDISISPDGNWAAIIDNGDFTKVRRLDLASGAVSTIAGVGVGLADGPASEAKFSNVVSGIRGNGLAVSPDGTWIAVADTENHAIRRVDVASRITSTLVGTPNNKLTHLANDSECTIPLLDLILSEHGR
jgi:DNA-binding beta-propeller fold protein YncE